MKNIWSTSVEFVRSYPEIALVLSAITLARWAIAVIIWLV